MKKLIYTAVILLPLFSFAGPSGGAGGGSTISIKDRSGLDITVPAEDVRSVILRNGEAVPTPKIINRFGDKRISIEFNDTEISEIQFNNGRVLIIQ